jgi:hypothetical protein
MTLKMANYNGGRRAGREIRAGGMLGTETGGLFIAFKKIFSLNQASGVFSRTI